MAKVFTITEGLENLGALKSGGQGSVYKARKTGEVISAIKILPTPISGESNDDKHFNSFQNEVQKLKKVNESPNPNVVSILASGLTTSGNFPYIEMEYIDGPDLAELLKPPSASVFSIKEAIKVADHLANAFAHCHRAGIKHGDIKSNNIKFNQRTGNYMLLDFGLSVMSDEQRRTSIRHAGAIEFMAPEQTDGITLFETDIYSFGVIMFELLTGTVPFPLNNKSEMARNAVMIAHAESTVPDLVSLRRNAMPDEWTSVKQQREMQPPSWILSMVYKCLEKDPSQRFTNGTELHEFIQLCMVAEEDKTSYGSIKSNIVLPDETEFQKMIDKLRSEVSLNEDLVEDLKIQLELKDKEIYQYKYMEHYNATRSEPKKKFSKSLLIFVLILAAGYAGFTAYHNSGATLKNTAKDSTNFSHMLNATDSLHLTEKKIAKKSISKIKRPARTSVKKKIDSTSSVRLQPYSPPQVDKD